MAARQRNLTGPILLIVLGALLLLNSLGFLTWRFWGGVWRYWPVFLIGAGLLFLLDRDARRPFHVFGWLCAVLAVVGMMAGGARIE